MVGNSVCGEMLRDGFPLTTGQQRLSTHRPGYSAIEHRAHAIRAEELDRYSIDVSFIRRKAEKGTWFEFVVRDPNLYSTYTKYSVPSTSSFQPVHAKAIWLVVYLLGHPSRPFIWSDFQMMKQSEARSPKTSSPEALSPSRPTPTCRTGPWCSVTIDHPSPNSPPSESWFANGKIHEMELRLPGFGRQRTEVFGAVCP